MKVATLILFLFGMFSCTKDEVTEPEDFSKDSGTFTDSRDNNVYKWVRIGDQIWMAENLAFLPSVYPPEYGSYTELRYYVYGYTGSDTIAAKQNVNYSSYGVLYNWPAAITASPQGWHLPSDEEWTTLEEYLIANGYNYDGTTGGTEIGKSLAANTMWNISTNAGAVGNNLAANNISGFSALPGGFRISPSIKSPFSGIASYGFWWSSTEYTSTTAKGIGLDCNTSYVFRSNYIKDQGFSIRCIKN